MIVDGKTTIIEMIINFWKLRTNNSLMIRINIWSTHTVHYYQIWRWFGVTVYVEFTATPIANPHLLETKLEILQWYFERRLQISSLKFSVSVWNEVIDNSKDK